MLRRTAGQLASWRHFSGTCSARSAASAPNAQEVAAGTPQAIADLLPFIACPFTKAPLRYDPQLQKLVCDELGVAYSVVGGAVPQLLPLMGEVLGEGGTAAGGSGGERGQEPQR